MSTEAARELNRQRWDKVPKDKACKVCGKPCRKDYCSTNCRVKAYQQRKKAQKMPFEEEG